MSRTRATGGLVEALAIHGLDVKWLNMATLRRWLGREMALRYARRTFARFAPDLVFVFCRDLPVELMRDFRKSARTVVWVEEPLDDMGQDYVDYLAHAHAVFMTNPSKFEWLSERGIDHAAFVLEGFSSTFHYPVQPDGRIRDLVFIGGPGRDGQRARFLAEVARAFSLEVYGKGWEKWERRYPDLCVRGPVKTSRYRKLCASSRIVLGLNQVNYDPLYFSNRTFFSLACRAFHLTHYVPRLEKVFQDGVHLAWYEGLDDCLQKIAYYLERPDERARIAEAGWRCACSEHQFTARIAYILQTLEDGLPAGREPVVVARPPESPARLGSLWPAPVTE